MASIDLYVDLVAAAFDAAKDDDIQQRLTTYYTSNKAFAFAAALRCLPNVDIAQMPAVNVFDSLSAAVATDVLQPAVWYQAAIKDARVEFERYKSYVREELSDMSETMKQNGEFRSWASTVKLIDLTSQKCWMWRRIKTPRRHLYLDILNPPLQDRVLAAKMPVLTSTSKKNTRAIVLSSARVFMETTKDAVRDSLYASLREAVQMRLHRMTERVRPTPETAGAAEVIPDFTPALHDLQQVLVAML